MLGTLEAARILRRVPGRSGGPPRYEIFHDVLAPAVLAWRSRRELESERAASGGVTGGWPSSPCSLVALAGTLALAAWALAQRAEAREQARRYHENDCARRLAELDSDPELSLALASITAQQLAPGRDVLAIARRSRAALS